MNQSSIDLNHNSVLLVEFSPSPCFELERISAKSFPSQVKKNFFLKKKYNKSYQYQLKKKKVPNAFTKIKV